MEHANAPLNIGVLISGSGSNLQSLIDHIEEGTLDAHISLVVSSRPDVYGIERAKKAGIPVLVMNREAYADASAANQRIADALKEAGAEYVVMAGYMRMVTAEILDAFPDRVVNLHPALLPSFKGAHAIQDAFDFGVKVTGVTVHFANADYDKGPIIAQRAVEVLESDTVDSLEARIHAVEHELYPHVVQLLSERRVTVDAATRTVRIAG
jgi:phosphoribosylglycinamide formyltransferase 1